MESTLGSTSQSSVTAFEQNDSLSRPQIDKADSNLSFNLTRNSEGEIGETTTIPSLTPYPPFPSTLFSEISSEQTFGTQVSVDEHDENKVQLAYPPSDDTDASQLPPLVPVRRHSQSQLNGRIRSATASPPVAQNTSIKVSNVPTPASSAAPQGHQLPSQNSQESYRVPTAQTQQTQPSRTSGNIPARSLRRVESWNSERSPSPTPQQYPTPLHQSAPTTSMYSGIPSQPYGPGRSGVTSQPYSSGPIQPSLPPQSAPPQLYHLPGVPTPLGPSMYAGSPFGYLPIQRPLQASSYSHPIAYNSIGQPTTSQTFKKANAFVASDPFRVAHRHEKVDAPSDGLTFDDIPAGGSLPGPVLTRPFRSNSLPIMPTQSRYEGAVSHSYSLPNRPTPHGPSIFEGTPEQHIPPPVPSPYYSTSNAPKPQTGQPIYIATPPQSYSLPNRPTPQAQSIRVGTPENFTPPLPSQYYSSSNAPKPYTSQPIYTGTSEQFIPQPIPSQFYSTPNPIAPQPLSIPPPSQIPGAFPGASYAYPTTPYFTGYNPTPHVIKPHSYVANDPFQVSYGGAAVDAASNFDNISTARSSPDPGMVSYGASYGGYHYPGTAQPPLVGQPIFTEQSAWGPTLDDSRPWNQPEIHYPRSRSRHRSYSSHVPLPDVPPTIIIHKDRHRSRRRHRRRHRQRSPSTSEDDGSEKEDTGLAHLQPEPPTVISPPEQSELQELNEGEGERKEEEVEGQRKEEEVSSAVPSIHHSRINAPNADDTVTPPADPVSQPSSPPWYKPSTQYEPHMGAGQSPFGSYPPYLPYSPYPPYSPHPPYSSYPQYPPYPLAPYLQYPQYQSANPPKKSIFSRFFGSPDHTHPQPNPQPFTTIYPYPFTQPYSVIHPRMDPEIDWHEALVDFFFVAFPKQIYLLLLLRLPSLYFSRVARIFEDADLSLPEIKKMALETASQGLTHEYEIEMAFESPSVPAAYKRLTSTWEYFIDSVMREWKTFNIISVLLLTAILTILQIESAADDPLTRYTALFSLMCSLISLLFGCMYIIRFGTMRKSYKAAEWALEAKKSKTLIWWNVWILLAMPAIWLTWSIVLYIACIMSFIWRTGVSSSTPHGLSNKGLLVIRIVMTVVLGLGVLYGVLIMTTFQRYGRVMDKAWKQRIDEWIAEKAAGNLDPYAHSVMSDDDPYRWRPDRWGSYQRPTHSRYHQPFGGRYPMNTVHIVPSSRSSSTSSRRSYRPRLPDSPRSSTHSKSGDGTTINQPGRNQPAAQPDSRVPQPSLGGMKPGFPTLNPKWSVPTGEEIPPKLIPERTLYPIVEASVTSPSEDGDNALGFSSGLANRNGGGGDQAPDDGNRVRFRLPSGSSDISDDWQGIIRPKKTDPRKTSKR